MINFQVIFPATEVCGVPDAEAARSKFESQLVFGEAFIAKEVKDGWAHGTCGHDGYKGYVDTQFLTEDIVIPTHLVTAARSHVYADATMKSQLVNTVSFGSRITIIDTTEKYAQMDTGEWIFHRHIEPIDSFDEDIVKTALLFVETPYYWGGRSGFGIDCSGLVQVVLDRAGIPAPRDTAEQMTAFGNEVGEKEITRGDIVFFPDHVGIMVDDNNIIHANAFHMKTIIEPLSVVAERSLKVDGKGIIAVRRI